LNPDVLHELMLSSPARADTTSPDLTPDVPVAFSSGTRRAGVTSSASKAAFTVLMERWPCAIDVDELVETALERAAPFAGGQPIDDMKRGMLEDLFGGVMHGLIELHTQPPPCTHRISDTPRAHPAAAFQADAGRIVVNAHHAMFDLDAMAIEVLKLADGRRRRADMIDVLVGGSRLDGCRWTTTAPPSPIRTRRVSCYRTVWTPPWQRYRAVRCLWPSIWPVLCLDARRFPKVQSTVSHHTNGDPMPAKDTTVDVLPHRLSEAMFDVSVVHLATVVAVTDDGEVHVQLDPGGPAVIARLALPATRERMDLAITTCQQTVVVFENGDRARPIIIGFIETVQPSPVTPPAETVQVVEADVDGKRVRVTAQDEIVRSGSARSPAAQGRVLIRGTYVETRSDGTNRIKGGQVQIN
jgi:hypothetical protein